MTKKAAVVPVLMFASAATLVLAACESSGNYRVGWVGDTPPPGDTGSSGSSSSSSGGSSSSSGGTASSSGGSSSSSGGGSSSGGSSSGGTGTRARGLVGNLIVTAGNTVIGVAGQHDRLAQVVNGKLPAAGVVTGTVTQVLSRTGQTLVKLGEGTGGSGGGLILDGVGGKVGALVGIDLGKGTVIAAPEGSKSLIGLNVLAANPTTGTLATVGAGSGGKLVTVEVNRPGAGTGNGGVLGTGLLGGSGSGSGNGLTGAVAPVVQGVTGAAAPTVQGVTGAVAPTVQGVTGAVAPAVQGVTGAVAPAGQGVTGAVKTTVGTVTGTVGGVLGGLKKK